VTIVAQFGATLALLAMIALAYFAGRIAGRLEAGAPIKGKRKYRKREDVTT
jgi:hypothetical protein